jgi:multidrug efflux system outer membrane protein
MMRKLIPLIGISIFLCGCPPKQPYVRPALPVPDAWPPSSNAGPGTPSAPVAPDVKWQDFFTDQRLQKVIELALANNRDLRIATLNIEQYQAFYRIRSAQLYPTISASASGNVYRLPLNLSGGDQAKTVAEVQVGLGTVAWELDFFGRIRSLKSAALEQYLATEQARSAAQISLVAAVANSYLALTGDRENLRLAQVTRDAQQASYELIRQSRDAGIASDLDVSQARSQVETAQVEIQRFSGQVALDESTLNLLVGAPVPPDLLPDQLGNVGALKDVEPGLPSDVLLRRPDISQAEHELKAANANIGAARAAFFPQISLTAAVGIASSDLTNLFKPAAGTWNVAPQAILPIFDYGARQANYSATVAQQDIAVAAYEKAIQTAFKEVSDSLSLRVTLVAQQGAQQSLVNSLEEAYQLSEARYKAGIDSYLSVLVAQRALFAAQQILVVFHQQRLNNLVTLYKVLGGGA